MFVWASETGRIISVETYQKDRTAYAKRSFKTQTLLLLILSVLCVSEDENEGQDIICGEITRT